MDEWIWIIIGLLLILVFYGLYNQSQPKRNKSTPTAAQETKPQSTIMETSKETVPVDLMPEVETKSNLIESSKNEPVNLDPEIIAQSVIKESNEREPIDVVAEVLPKSVMIENPTAEPVNPSIDSVPKKIKIEKPVKPE